MSLPPFSLKIETELLTADYLNPFYYRSEFILLDEYLRRRRDSKSLGELIGRTGPSHGPTIYQGKSPTGGTASDGRLALVMPRMLTGRGLERGNDFVPPSIEKEFESRRLRGGEVLLLRSAHKAEYIGASVDLFVPNGQQAVPSDTIIAIRCDISILDPGFLVSFLRSRRFGYPQIQRRITSQNAKLTPEALSSVRVIVPEPEWQWAIGMKVRVAEHLHVTSTQLGFEAVNSFDALMGYQDWSHLQPSTDGSCTYFSRFIPTDDLFNSIGAQFYAPKRQNAVRLVRLSGRPFARLGDCGSRVRLN